VGTFTFADVVAYRLKQKPVRSAAAIGTLAVIIFYLIAQMVATGSLIKLLFGIPYVWSVILVGSVMLLYVMFGGMLATTWVQVVKAILLLTAGALLAFLVLWRFDLNPLKLFAVAAEKYGTRVLQPGTRVVSGQWPWIDVRHRRDAPRPDEALHCQGRQVRAALDPLRDRPDRHLSPFHPCDWIWRNGDRGS
jgi:cation/acetate symporter